MLEHVPEIVGRSLRGIGPGLGKLMIAASWAAAPDNIVVTSPDFTDGTALPHDSTEDGRKLSPALAWHGLPDDTAEVVLVIEDADSPTPSPLVHAIVVGLPGRDSELAAGDLKSPGSAGRDHRLGLNSFLKAAYLPPDPPPGHGPHRYAIQVFALDRPLALEGEPGRGALAAAMAGRVIGKGLLVGTYERR